MAASKHSTPPAITAPVSRTLLVRDTESSIAFYKEVLGFQADATAAGGQEVILVNGPAQIVLEQVANDSTPPPSLVYFEVNDVWTTHAAITTRGGKATAPEKVNWIKVEFFSVQDPDGHILWFGKSYHEFYEQVHSEAGVGQLRKIMPEMPLTNVPAGIAYYRDVLGFSINYAQHDLGVMDRDSVRLLLIQRTPVHTGIGSCCCYIRDADALHRELMAKGASIPAPPVSHPWGLRDFTVIDPEGNRLSFAQTFE
ncbi:VOC family protein [Paraflavitalea sp. CAU 1676]|uniref:VOC family protein n=1 Tax=Paraflavitalea sp. CAU 1676 TaxID=3032598 RepID=UPI0023DC3EA6|nr:VOC family protein [Paraflavitalea sp. CAU 1676]MDF2188037.1 VOC family protein [Paraflavitalea sp. CAU 1676]